ncbi:MAG: transcriptional regulator, partial [Pseudomonadota bacterium]
LDWLLGLSQSDQLATEVAPSLAIEVAGHRSDDSRVEKWRQEATGYKIRYAPATLPDLLRTNDVVRWEYQTEEERAEGAIAAADSQIAYSRRPETDMEVVMPLQRLVSFARGNGMWEGLPPPVRRDQIKHMVHLLDDLYPTFRLFLYDEREAYSAPYTVFGPLRAAIYVGQCYLVMNATEHIRALTDHFDSLIRRAKINPHESAQWVMGLLEDVTA